MAFEIIKDQKSTNFGKGGNKNYKIEVNFVIVHYTAGTEIGDLPTLLGKTSKEVSAHYYVTKDGRIYELVAPPKRAWHAGVSKWEHNGRVYNSLNEWSIGIELENLNGNDNQYPKVQIEALVFLAKYLQNIYPILMDPLRWIGHEDICPGRKFDPGKLFPWTSFRNSIGSPTSDPDWLISMRWLYNYCRNDQTGLRNLNIIRSVLRELTGK